MPEARPKTTPDAFLTEALTLADDYADSAVHHGEYTNWIGRFVLEGATKPEDTAAQARALNYSIYSGVPGVALFLANAWRFSQDPRHFDAARGAILEATRQATRLVNEYATKPKKEVWGFYSGIVGVYWTANEIASLLDDRYLAERAAPILEGLRPLANDRQTETDLIGGHAGAIPALLSVARHAGVKEARETAIALGEELIARAIVSPTGAWAWDRVSRAFPRPLTGFTHGAAGYAYAFGELYKATGEERWLDGARRALQYERDSFVPEQGGWPDFRYEPPVGGAFRVAHLWCHGSGGIGLSRILLRDALDDPLLTQEAAIARISTARTTRQRLEMPGHIYHACHGIAGNAESLWIIEAGLGVPGALARAREIGDYGIERYGHVAKARWASRFVDWPSPHPGHRELSLLTGVAGIGHSYLRLHAPDQVASILVPGLSWKDAASIPYRSPEERASGRVVEVANA